MPRRAHAELRAGGQKRGRERIARPTRAAGLIGASRRRTGVTTTRGLPALAVALDAWRRGIVGRSKANHPRVEPALDALEMAIGRRRPGNVIDHGDQGRQCASPPFADRRDEAGARPLMGSVGDGCDNAPREGFLATLERERLDRRRFASQAAAGMARFSFIEGWRNPVRSHFVLGCRSPMARAAAMDQIAAKPS